MKLWLRAVCCAVVLSCIFSLAGFCGACEDISGRVLRLHIIANSDSEEDQALKLRVRDAVIKKGSELFRDCADKSDAERIAGEKLGELQECAAGAVRESGYDYPVRIELTNMSFDTRVYDDFTLPAGRYDALRIVIGEGMGHNWWCVIYPAVCIPCAEKNIGSVLTDGETELVSGSSRYEVKFRFVEILQGLFSFFG